MTSEKVGDGGFVAITLPDTLTITLAGVDSWATAHDWFVCIAGALGEKARRIGTIDPVDGRYLDNIADSIMSALGEIDARRRGDVPDISDDERP